MKLTCTKTGVALFDFDYCPVCLSLHRGKTVEHARRNKKHFSCDDCMGRFPEISLPKLWPFPWGTRRGAPPRGGSK
jgi:hypothetical protein